MTRSADIDINASSMASRYLAGESVRSIANDLGIDSLTVSKRLDAQGVARRKHGEWKPAITAKWLAYQERRTNHCTITPHVNNVIDGILLSDAACVRGRGRMTARLLVSQHPSRLDWLVAIGDALAAASIVSKIDDLKPRPMTMFEGRPMGGRSYKSLNTPSYPELVAVQERWYPNGKKAIPSDISLTPTTLLHWFCGDGCGVSDGTVKLYTNGFDFEGVELIASRMERDLQIRSRVRLNKKGQPVMVIERLDDAYLFSSLIKEMMPSSCLYKLRHIRQRKASGRGRRLDDSIRSQIRNSRWTETCQSAASRYGVSTSTVWKLWTK